MLIVKLVNSWVWVIIEIMNLISYSNIRVKVFIDVG